MRRGRDHEMNRALTQGDMARAGFQEQMGWAGLMSTGAAEQRGRMLPVALFHFNPAGRQLAQVNFENEDLAATNQDGDQF